MTISTMNVEIVTITASEDKVITNGEVYSEVGGTVYLSSADDASAYYEISEEEYNAVLAEKNKNTEDTTS